MLNKQHFPRFLFLTSLLLGNLVFIPIALGQDRPPLTVSNRLPDQWEGSDFRPPSNIGSPRSTQSGGRRNPNDRCIASGQLPPTALVPSSGFGITQEAYPQISWYLPPNTAEAMEIIIFNEQDQEIYSTWYSLKNAVPSLSQQPNQTPNQISNQSLDKGQIMSLKIPQNTGISPLEIGKVYYWEVSLICDMNNRTRDLPTGGYIQRVIPNTALNSQLQQATPPEQIVLYANARLWYETVGVVVNMQRQGLQDLPLAANLAANTSGASVDVAGINMVWAKLLNSAGLNQIAQQPIFLGAANPYQ